jgi:alkaline phosphatase D
MKRRRLMVLVLGLVGLFSSQPSLAVLPPITFTHGVASGDVTPFSAVLWTRVNQPGAVTAEVAREPTFTKVIFKAVIRARAEDDFTVKVRAAPLAPNGIFFYR